MLEILPGLLGCVLYHLCDVLCAGCSKAAASTQNIMEMINFTWSVTTQPLATWGSTTVPQEKTEPILHR